MSRGTRLGVCRLCGQKGELSFEHVPPKAAYNDQTVFRMEVEKFYELEDGQRPRGFQKRGGWGYHSLCIPCNNMTGRMYAPSFIKWCKEGMLDRRAHSLA